MIRFRALTSLFWLNLWYVGTIDVTCSAVGRSLLYCYWMLLWLANIGLVVCEWACGFTACIVSIQSLLTLLYCVSWLLFRHHAALMFVIYNGFYLLCCDMQLSVYSTMWCISAASDNYARFFFGLICDIIKILSSTTAA